MQGEQKSPFPMMLNVGGRGIPFDHVLEVNTTALESHKTVLITTTSGTCMVHDDAALEVARMFGMREAAEATPAAPQESGVRSQKPGGKREK